MTDFLPALGLLLALAGAAHALIVLLAVCVVPQRLRRQRERRWPASVAPASGSGAASASSPTAPGVTVLKPLHGDEPRLYENLRSVCMQAHLHFQILFGAASADDPALAVAQRLRNEFPALDIAVLADARRHGRNHKVSNLINLLPHAKHEHLVIADSDIAVPPDWLARVAAPLADPAVGLVSCPYFARPLGRGESAVGVRADTASATGKRWSWAAFGAQFVNGWFLPNVLLTRLFGDSACAFGSTLALRRAALQQAGGFEAIRDAIADDWRLADNLRRVGLRTVLSDCFVTTDVAERSAVALAGRELRWLRVSRNVQPEGFAFVFLAFGGLGAVAGLMLGGNAALCAAAFAVSLAARYVTARVLRRHWPRAALDTAHAQAVPASTPAPTPLATALAAPLRDAFTLVLWIAAYGRRRVRWHGEALRYAADGDICDEPAAVSPLAAAGQVPLPAHAVPALPRPASPRATAQFVHSDASP